MYLITLQRWLPLGACCACCTCRLIDTPQSSIWHKHTALLLVPSQLGPGHVGKLLIFPVFWGLAGPVGRLLTSARMYQNNLKVLIFCRLVGVVDGHIPSAGWLFFLQVLHCVKALQGDGWQGLVQVLLCTIQLLVGIATCP